ncbi:hypothetical protein GLYMA_10G079351v4 [Glycine max]|nr:hypothetical protein GLYMA_10G079351v4 [Glycine max]KAH1137282.1 hypothetical protein GYH30_027317 [Glycine max]
MRNKTATISFICATILLNFELKVTPMNGHVLRAFSFSLDPFLAL